MSKTMARWEMDLTSKAESTRRQYTSSFAKFLERWGLSPDEFYERVLRGIRLRHEDPGDYREVQNMVTVAMAEMRRAGRAASTCGMIYKAVRSFLEAQGIEEFKIKAKDKPRGQSNGQRLVLADQIRELYDYVGAEFKRRNRALMMFLKDSGMRISDAAALTCGDYAAAETATNEAGEEFREFEPFETKKTGAVAYIHVGPEAIREIDAYLEERAEREGRPSPDSPLFPSREGGHLSKTAISTIFSRLAEKLGKRGRRISAHSLRKFHTTMLEAAMPRAYVAKLQGKKVTGSMGPYERPEEIPGELMRAYIEAYEKIRVFGEGRAAREARSEVEELQRQVSEQQRTIDMMMPAFEMIQQQIARMNEWNRLRDGETSRETRVDRKS